MNIVDLIIAGILIIGAVGGYRKGFVASLVGAFSSIIGLVVAYNYYPLAARWLNENLNVTEYLNEFLSAHLVLPQPVTQFKPADLPLLDISKHLDSINMTGSFKTQLLLYLDKLKEGLLAPLQGSLGDIIHQFLASAIISAIAFVVIWFLVDFTLQLVAKLFSSAIRNTAIGHFDRIAGLLVGLLLTALVITVFTGLFTPLLKMADIAKPTMFSAVMKTMGEAKLMPYFSSAFDFLFSKFMSLLPM